jgi:hypothetical protein
MENRRRISRTYDPRGLFQKQVVGRFILLIPNLALDVSVVSSEDTYYIYVAAAEAGGDRSRRDIHLNLLDIYNYMDVLLNWVLL